MGRHRRKKGLPIRTGLLGASAAMAVGAVAVTTGLLPGGDTFTVGSAGDSSSQVRTRSAPELRTQGETSAKPTAGIPASPSHDSVRPTAPAKKPSAAPTKPAKQPKPPTKPSAAPSKAAKAPEAKKKPSPAPTRERSSAPIRTAEPSKPSKPAAPTTPSAETTAEAAVLKLVNDEREKVGCSPVKADPGLAKLADAFSVDMAERGFFDHTNPDGATPWDRAAKAGVTNLGGENIARGQADAAAVMDAWMNSEGHRQNILNCDYKTLGVGVFMGDGGPWWTQDFGFQP
ncbi:CAP domain-containing protein [Streptomyces sp. NPDC002889]|uniref:CAP domain-containing protein n=1 Tax=Streptomyces sp. NPDC002889 TaxID=3364669 RepID=UPI00369C669E